MKKNECNFYAADMAGHRASYLEVLESNFHGESVGLLKGLFSRKPFFFLMVEDSFFAYFFISAIRSIFGFRTLGLLFRVKPCLNGDYFSVKIKYFFLRLLRGFDFAYTISLLPFSVDHRIEKICDIWIYDIQFWDLDKRDIDFYNFECKKGKRKLLNQLELIGSYNMDLEFIEKQSNLNLIVSIGEQTKIKGFVNFLKCANYSFENKELSSSSFVFGGRVSPELQCLFANDNSKKVLGLNKRLTDSEIISFYALSDFVWCCYLEEYDQASGIFGRALQLNKFVIVRCDSYLQCFCKQNNIPHISLNFSGGNDEMIFCEYMTFGGRKISTEEMRKFSLKSLAKVIKNEPI